MSGTGLPRRQRGGGGGLNGGTQGGGGVEWGLGVGWTVELKLNRKTKEKIGFQRGVATP